MLLFRVASSLSFEGASGSEDLVGQVLGGVGVGGGVIEGRRGFGLTQAVAAKGPGSMKDLIYTDDTWEVK